MNKKIFSVILALSVFFLYRCTEKKPTTATQVVLANPEFGGFDSQVLWGEHLVTIAGCNDCHTPKKMGPHGPELDTALRLSGHPAMMPRIDVNKMEMEKKGLVITSDLTEWVGAWGTSFTANLTPDATGTGNWTIDNFMMAVREGKFKGVPTGRPLLPPMPWEMYKHMSDYELKAVFAYLRSIKPIKNVVSAPLPPAMAMAAPSTENKTVEPKASKQK